MNNTIFFGNGINLLSKQNKSWNSLLTEIKGVNTFNNGILPNTMIYERILFERPRFSNQDILIEEELIKKSIADSFSSIINNHLYRELFDLNAHNYITTNYDYAFRNTISKELEYEYIDNSTEDIYSIRRKIEIRTNGTSTTNIWHIHGEINKPKTIMLGMDHYCGEIGKIDNFIKGSYEYNKASKPVKLKSIKEKLLTNKFDEISWVELFFTSDIYIIGFSFDFSEIDLWWILTKRARIIKDIEVGTKVTNKIYYYCNAIDNSKKGLFESLGVEVIEIKVINDNWLKNYKDIIMDITNKIAKR